MDNLQKNPPLQTIVAWAVITALAIFGIFAPAIFDIDGFKGGFAISLVSFFLVLSGIIVMAIYVKRARLLNNILNGQNVLVHWTYDAAEWQKYSEKEFKMDKQEKKALFYVISGFALFFGILFFILDHEGGIWVLVAMLALIAIIAFTAWFTSRFNYRQNRKYHGETYIAEKAIYLNRQLHTWYGPGDKLESVVLDNKANAQAILKFKYSVITRTGFQSQTVRIPVPRGKENEAQEIVNKFSSIP